MLKVIVDVKPIKLHVIVKMRIKESFHGFFYAIVARFFQKCVIEVRICSSHCNFFVLAISYLLIDEISFFIVTAKR